VRECIVAGKKTADKAGEASAEQADTSAGEPQEDSAQAAPETDEGVAGAADDGDGRSDQSGDQVAPGAPTGTAAAPLTPDEATVQRSPHLGRPDSSTNPVSANAAIMSPPGSAHVGLVDEDGKAIPLDEVFEFPGPDNPRHVATVKQRTLQNFRYPNTDVVTTHLLYPAGAEVPVGEAMRVVETFKHAAADEAPTGA
jgi:hypothetical protein